MAQTPRPSTPPPLSVFDAIALMVGLVIGVGLFRTPSIVASHVSSELMFMLVWVAGGLITLIGALCYAELAAAHPHAGGEYHFLSRAFGKPVALLFGWGRCTVIQTGSIAAVAFMLGDYLNPLLPLGEHGPALYAALTVVLLTAVHVAGATQSRQLQAVVTLITLAAMLAIIAFGFFGSSAAPTSASPGLAPERSALGVAMIFVLLTYGGWNEAAYLTGELQDASRNIARVLLIGTAILVTLYLLVNGALLAVLGLDGMRHSPAVASDMMRVAAGPWGGLIVALAIVVAAIATLNATLYTGARVFFAMARDVPALRWAGVWHGARATPVNSLLLQGGCALALIALGSQTRDGFEAMVDYTAPVFWGFLLLVGLSLFVLRRREPGRVLPYRVPWYPVTPILFCLSCLYMLHASILYTGMAAVIGLLVLAAGMPLLWLRTRPAPSTAADEPGHAP